MTKKELRAKQARAKMLKARADAQAFNQSIWPTVAYRHGNRGLKDHGTYFGAMAKQVNRDKH